jgi:AcrR family transcriptional regulator
MTERQISTTIVADDLDADGGALDADPARPMRADARRNEERLVAAARHVFNQQGGEASMDAIAKEAGVGIGTLYRHFPKRINVVEAVYKTDVDGLVATAHEVVDTMDPWAAMVSWLEAFVDYASTKRNFLTELHEAFEKAPELRVASRERIVGALSIVLDRAQAAGVVRQDLDGPDLMQLLGSMCMSATLTEDQSERLLLLILDGLRPPQPRS